MHHFGNGQGLYIHIRFNMDASIGTERERGSNLLLAGTDTDGNHNDFIGFAGFSESDAFFDGYFVKRIYRHFDVVQIYARIVAQNANIHVVVNNTLGCYKNFHGFLCLLRVCMKGVLGPAGQNPVLEKARILTFYRLIINSTARLHRRDDSPY
jgi:hypothetical protein